jgi:CheY-like chemotaxis protein
VLVVDDSALNCEVARRILQGQGATVVLASNGLEALDWLVAHPEGVDLVLMDVQMPVVDGIEATRLLRRMPQFYTLPIVAMTAGAFKSQKDAAQAAGMTHFISKPFDVPSTIALIQRLCHRPVLVMDLAQGLDIWMGMPAYKDYLQRFVAGYHNAVALMHTSLAQGDRLGAAALAHKLAGEAANLALPDTLRLAAEAERVLRTALDPAPDPTPVLADLALALARAVAAIKRLASQA